MTHRISAHILPLARITLRGSQLAIPIGHAAKLHPSSRQWSWSQLFSNIASNAREMGYLHRSAHKKNERDQASRRSVRQAIWRPRATADDCCMTSRRCQNLSALRGTCSHINDNRTVMLLPRQKMKRMLT